MVSAFTESGIYGCYTLGRERGCRLQSKTPLWGKLKPLLKENNLGLSLLLTSVLLTSRLISYFLFLIFYFLFFISYILFFISYFLFLISYFLYLRGRGGYFRLNDQNNFSIKNIFINSIGTERVRWFFVSESFKKKFVCLERRVARTTNTTPNDFF